MALAVAGDGGLHIVGAAFDLLGSSVAQQPQDGGRGVWQATLEYWQGAWRRLSVRLGFSLDEALPDPVVQVLRSAKVSDEEVKNVRRQQESYYHDDSAHSVRITLYVSMPIFLLSLLGFELLLRGKPGGFRRALGVPRLAFPAETVAGLGGSAQTTVPAGMLDPTETLLSRDASETDLRSWSQRALARQVRCRLAEMLRAVLTVDEGKVLECAGLDALMMLRFCALCGRFCALAGVSCLLLAPLYSFGGRWWPFGHQGMSRFTLANLRQGSLLLWAVVPAAYCCNLALCGLLWKEYERFVQLRRNHLGGEALSRPGMLTFADASTDFRTLLAAEFPWRRGLTPPPLSAAQAGEEDLASVRGSDRGPMEAATSVEQMRRTVVVERLPLELQEPAALRACFEEMLGAGAVHSVAMVPHDARKLSNMLLERARLLREGEDPGTLAALEDRLRTRREEFGRAMAGTRSLYSRTTVTTSGFEISSSVPSQLSDMADQQDTSVASAAVRSVSAPWMLPPSGGADELEDASMSFTLRDLFSGALPSQRTPQWRARAATGGTADAALGPPGGHGGGEAAAEAPRAGGGGAGPSACCPPALPAADVLPRRTNPAMQGRSWTSSNSDEAFSARGANTWGGTSSFRELCLAASLSVRTAMRSIVDALRALITVVRGGVGGSIHRIGQLLPASALGTSAPPSALNTPFSEPRIGSLPGARCLPADAGGAGARAAGARHSSSTAFVTLRTLQATCVACQVVLDEDPVLGSELVADQAPEPRDVVWHNAARPQAQRLVRQFFVEVALSFGLAFWSVPVSLLQAWCSVARLQNLLGPSFRLPPNFLNSNLYALLTLYLPVMALLGLLEVLPVLLYRLASRYEGIKSRSALQMLTMQRYWRFQLATIAVTVLSGCISDSVKAIMDDPASVLWQLGQSVPKVAVYFLVTVLSYALVVAPVSLLRLPVLARFAAKAVARCARCLWRCLRRGGAQQRSPETGPATAQDFLQSPDHAADLSALLLVLLVCVTYATIAPLILPAGLLFFVVKWSVLAVQYLYVHVPRFDSGGAFWYLLWNQALFALIFGNLTTLAVVGLRSGYAQLPFLLPLPVLPLGFKLRAEYRFAEPSRRLPLRLARALDAQDPWLADRFSPDAYWHPALRLAEGELRAGRRGGDRDANSCPMECLIERKESEDAMGDWPESRISWTRTESAPAWRSSDRDTNPCPMECLIERVESDDTTGECPERRISWTRTESAPA